MYILNGLKNAFDLNISSAYILTQTIITLAKDAYIRY